MKGVLERLIVRTGATSAHRSLRRSRVLVLAYHNVVPDETPAAGDRSLHLRLSDFNAQLDSLSGTHEIVRLTEAFAPSDLRRRPRAVITFDDAYRGAVRLGLPEVSRRGLVATLFVAPGLLGRACWWDRWVDPNQSGWDSRVRSRLLAELRGEEGSIDDWARRAGQRERDPGPWHQIATAVELDEAATLAGVDIGCHSWSHRNLAALAAEAVADEIAHTIAWLQARYRAVIPWIAYPYGLSSPVVERVAQGQGLAGGLAVSGGWWPPNPMPRFDLPRWNVPAGVSLAGFELRTAGLFCR